MQETFAETSMGTYFDNKLLSAVLAFAVSFLAFYIIKKLIIARIEHLFKKTKNQWDDIFSQAFAKLTWPFYASISAYFSIQFLDLEEKYSDIIEGAVLVVVVYYIARFAEALFSFSIGQWLSQRKSGQKFDEGVIGVIKLASRTLVWTIALILVLQNLGYNVTALIGGLGIAGIAVGLAVQNLLGDIFSFFSIHFDKPFRVGDFIIVGDDMGTVEKIGIKSTRIAALTGQQLVIPNQELTSSRINNYMKMEKRRIQFSIGVTYQTKKSKLEKIPKLISDIINSVEQAEIDRVHFKSFGDWALIYEIVYYIDSSDYNVYMDIQQKINLAIVERFEKEKMDMAYPTQMLYYKKSE